MSTPISAECVALEDRGEVCDSIPENGRIRVSAMDTTQVTIPIERIGVCSWSLRPEDGTELLTSASRLGLPKIQLALAPVVENPSAFGDVIPRLRAAGIVIASGMFGAVGEDYSTLDSIRKTGGVRPDGHWMETRERGRRVASLAESEGLSLVTFHAGFIPHLTSDPTRGVVLDRLRTLADIFGEHGVRIGLETGQETAATLVEALEHLDHENVGVNFDPANMILYGMGDPVESLKLLADHVVQIHAKDAIPTETPGTWGREVQLGTGAVDWNRFLEVVSAIERPVDLMIEREGGEVRESDILAARRRLTGA